MRLQTHAAAIPAVVAILFSLPPAAWAQTTGRIVGRVTSAETGKPIAGAQLSIRGTELGNLTAADGRYFVHGVPPGRWRLEASFLGFRTEVREVPVFADRTVPVDFALVPSAVPAEPIEAIVPGEPLLLRDRSVTVHRESGEEARELPRDDIVEVIGLSPGVYGDRDELVLRGGRVTEAAVYLDGVLLTDYARQSLSARPGIFGLEEVDVLTGAFGPEFGHAQSGVVSLVTRDPTPEWHGQLRLTLDAHPGTDGYDGAEAETFAKEPCCGYRALQGSISGPLAGDRLGAFGSLELIRTADVRPAAAGFNPAVGVFNSSGSTETVLPGNRGNRIHSLVKLSTGPGGASRVTATWLYGREQEERYDASNGLRPYLSSTGVRLVSHDAILAWDQPIVRTPTRDLRVRLSAYLHTTEIGRGTPRSSAMAAVLADQLGDRCGAECVVEEEPFASDLLGFDLDRLTFFFEDSAPGAVAGTRTPTASEPDPVFGLRNAWSTVDGFEPFFARRDERRWGVRAEAESRLGRHHVLRGGLEWNAIELDVRGRRLETVFDAEVYTVRPRTTAAWLQDRIDLGDLVLEGGLRWDRWAPRTRFPVIPRILPCSIPATPGTPCFDFAEAVEAPVRDVLAPRLAVAMPVTDRTHVRLSYGQYYQLPELRRFFENYNAQGFDHGNPYLDYVKTTAFEVGITTRIGDRGALDLVGYHRDRSGAVRLDVVPAGTLDPVQNDLAMFGNGDFGTVKGVELTLRRGLARYLGVEAAWALQWARGTTSSPTSFVRSRGLFRDPLDMTMFLQPPTELSAEDFDRMSDVGLRVQARLPRGFGAGTTLGRILERTSADLVVQALSGTPYTRVDPFRGTLLEPINASRNPWTVTGDLRVTRTLEVTDGVDLSLFGTIYNLLDRTNVRAVHPTTGRPDRSGLEDRAGPLPFPFGFVDDDGPRITDWPLPVDRVVPERVGQVRLWDLDGDGVVTEAETGELLRRAEIALGADFPSLYGEPRLVRFGAEIRF